MLKTIEEATQIVKKNLPKGKIQAVVWYRGLYLFMVFREDPFEEEVDPFYSIDQQTGEFKEFSLFTDGNINEVLFLFQNKKGVV